MPLLSAVQKDPHLIGNRAAGFGQIALFSEIVEIFQILVKFPIFPPNFPKFPQTCCGGSLIHSMTLEVDSK